MSTTDPVIVEVPASSTLARLAFELRHEVFVGEQHVPPALEFDGLDDAATHLVAIRQGEVAGTLRIILLPEHAKIGRVAVRLGHRRQGVARAMMLAAMHYCRGRGQERMYLTAQSDKTALYHSLGFAAFGEEFDDAGMPHRAMKTY